MHEEFIYYVWKNKLFYSDKLQTTEGELVEIINTGRQNSNSGPDFLNAKIKIILELSSFIFINPHYSCD